MIPVPSLLYVAMGALFGLTAGISPGPLLTLVITETLHHNKTEGMKVAIAPLITDVPIIGVTFFIFSRIAQLNILLGVISFLGGIFIAYLGYETIKTKDFSIQAHGLKPESLRKGITVNFLNPSPYLFWLTVGTPLAFQAYEVSTATVILFFISFYTLLVGSKIIIVFIVERSKTVLKNKAYSWTMRILGIILFIFVFVFFYDGMKLMTGQMR